MESLVFEKDQGDSKLKITLVDWSEDISEKQFKKDLEDLTSKVLISDWNDGENGVISMGANYKNFEKGKMRSYDLEPTFKDANISIDTQGKRFWNRERYIHSNKFETHLHVGRKYFIISHENSEYE